MSAQKKKLRILFLCTGNSCRSQMAEGLTNHFKGDQIEAYSAGTKPQEVNLHAIQVMKEIGIDISKHQSKSVQQFLHTEFDFVITVCDDAYENCPFLPGTHQIVHVGFPDPPRIAKELAAKGASQEEQLNCYREVRDQIWKFVMTLPDSLTHLKKS